jgi:ATP-dependent helicase HrpA
MISMRLGDPHTFPYLDPPTKKAINEGYQTLFELGALKDRTTLTPNGRIMANLPMDPRMAKIIIEGAKLGALKEIKIITAALTILDPRIRPAENAQKADTAHRMFQDKQSDFISYLHIWDSYQDTYGSLRTSSSLRKFCKKNYLSWQRMREWFDVHEQISRLLKKNKFFKENEKPATKDTIHQALTCGFIRNICQKKDKNTYMISGGREISIFPGSSLYNNGGSWIIAAYFVETSKLYARTTANIAWVLEVGTIVPTVKFSISKRP